MRVTVLLPGMLRANADGQAKLVVNVSEPATLGTLLDLLAKEYPALERRLRDEQAGLRRYVNFYIDGEECRFSGGPDAMLRDTGEVQIIPSVAGGSALRRKFGAWPVGVDVGEWAAGLDELGVRVGHRFGR